ncbi:hypothetical protein BDB00DRAFT_340133 [Zychaea mexicana]|uniref:uncharacterized protein n=1 Tax=Zychaea mexicana TaxID=64656 RepID=UPI0022FDE40C|nr:uncharacterized protein BDB00DRAFT_340133 [Zychaea mexicana]KAI9493989.1 hypothetical protein BDB00DRAFT_340133 [Zychaea mexicana]
MSNQTSEWNRSHMDDTTTTTTSTDQQLKSVDPLQHRDGEQQVATSSSAAGGGHSSWIDDFPSPQEVAAADKHKHTSAATGVSDLLSKPSPSPMNSSESNNTRSYAFVTDFPSPQEASKAVDSHPSTGVSDLLHHDDDDKTKRKGDKVDSTVPPHPQRSFANVAGNKDFPSLEPSPTPSAESTESLSHIPDVKEMLGSASVKVKPPPPSQSFAKMAAKPPPPQEEKPSPRAVAVEKQNQELANQPADPSDVSHENFPTLAQANQMAEQGAASTEDRAMFTEISKIGDAAEAAATADPAADVEEKKDKAPSFAKVTGSNLDKAPPSASSVPVPSHPQYDEQTMLNASAKREARKWKQQENNNTHEEDKMTTPEQVLLEERKEEIQEQKENEAAVVSKRIELFDRRHKGKFTMLDTFKTLRGMGYSFLTAIPITVLMHLRMSPLTSPYRFPFLYRSLTDYFTLPIYTNKLVPALGYGAPLLTGRRGADLVTQFGRQQRGTNTVGLTFWDGLRGMRHSEKRQQFWQVSTWAVHRLQWMAVYTLLQDPNSHLVTADALSGLPAVSSK